MDYTPFNKLHELLKIRGYHRKEIADLLNISTYAVDMKLKNATWNTSEIKMLSWVLDLPQHKIKEYAKKKVDEGGSYDRNYKKVCEACEWCDMNFCVRFRLNIFFGQDLLVDRCFKLRDKRSEKDWKRANQ